MKKTFPILFVCLIAFFCLFVSCSSEEKNGSDGQKTSDTTAAPTIDIDFGSYDSDNIPFARKGEEYKVFSASAEDAYGKELAVGVKVWLYYSSVSRAMITVSDNIVTPEIYGEYTVEYSVTDDNGNDCVETYRFWCVDKEESYASFDGDKTSFVSGEKVDVRMPQFHNCSGNVEYRFTAVLKSNDSITYNCDGGYFIPLYAGDYAVVCNYKDYIGCFSSSYEISVSANSDLVFIGKPDINKYYIADCQYTLPKVEAYSLASGFPEKLETTIRLDGEAVGEVFKPTKEGKFVLEYSAAKAEKTIKQTFDITVVDVGFAGNMNMDKYFYSEDASATITNSGVNLSFDKENVSVDFIVPQYSVEFSASFVIDKKLNSFGSVDLILSSGGDADRSIKFTLKKGTGNGCLFGSGSTFVKVNDDFDSGTEFEFLYNNDTRSAVLSGCERVYAATDISGNEFKGFESENISFSLNFNGATAESLVKIVSVNNQVFSNIKGDGIKPNVVFDEYRQGVKQIGDVVEIGRIYCCDTLSSISGVQYFVKSPSGDYAKDTNGKELSPENTDYRQGIKFVADQLGDYVVYILATDYFGNTADYYYNVTVKDFEPPAAVLGKGAEKSKKGEKIEIKSISVRDNLTEKPVIYVYYVDPYGKIVSLDYENGEKEILLKYSGVYKVGYYVFDENNNFTIVSYEINVA